MIPKSKPNLILLAGPAGCGKTQHSIEAFQQEIGTRYAAGQVLERNGTEPVPAVPGTGIRDPLSDDLLLILPTAEHRTRTMDLILRRDLGGFFQRRITTFDRALREFLKLGGIEFATDVTRRIVLKEILMSNEFLYFKDAVAQPGFLDLLGKMIVELKEYLISPQEFKRRLSSLQERFPEFELKYADLEKIYEAYETELKKRSLIDQRDSLRLLEEGLERGEFANPRLRKVWIDGFSDFSKLQLAFIEFLTRHADEVTVTLTVDDGSFRGVLFRAVSETQTALEDMGFKKQWMRGPNYRTHQKGLEHLQENLFCEKGVQKIKPDDSVQIFEATGLSGEMEMIAREAKRLVRTFGYHFSDIALLFRTTDPYISVIKSVFNRFQIPLEIHERFRLKATPIARTLRSFFEILSNDWRREDLFNFLKSSYVCADYEMVCEIELRALQKGIFRDRAYWLRSFPQAESLRDIAQFEDRFLNLKNVDQFAVWVKALMQHFGLLRFPDTTDERTRIDREAARRIFLLLEELKTKSKAWRESNPLGFVREFTALAEVDLFSVHSRDKNKVQVYNISLARQKEYQAVFLAGLLEKQFPIQIKEDPLLSDAERRVLNEKGEVLKERLPRQAFERYLFYLAATRAREHLILSYPRFNLEGKEMLPSFYVDEVRALYEGELCTKKQPITAILPRWEDAAIPEELEALIVQNFWAVPQGNRKDREDRLALALYHKLIGRPGFRALVHRLLQPDESVIQDERIQKYFKPETGTWSPTYLEEYAECPYRFFAHRHLGLESQTQGIDIRRKGTILHDVLQAVFTWQRDQKKGSAGFEEAETFAMEKFSELWAREPLTGERYYRVELEKKEMQEMLLGILELELVQGKPPIEGLIPRYFEYAFRGLRIKGKRREVSLNGKIDRIDVDPSGKYALVIDYKTGKQFSPRALENGTSLQLPFYLIAVRETLGLKPLGGHLYSLSKAHSSGFHHKDHLAQAGVSTGKRNHLSEEEFTDLLSRSVQFAEKFTDEIEHGKIPVEPRDCVSYCPYSAVCRIEKWRLPHLYRKIAERDQAEACEEIEAGS